MKQFSILDLASIPEGSAAADAFANSADFAARAEALGFHRYWLAEHHNMPGIASAATSIVIAHVAGATKTMRIGAGGIMLPNHAPLVIAEQFGTLEALYPGRIDLGLGRAPGSDMLTARALRRNMVSEDSFPADVAELQGYLGEAGANAQIQAVPGQGSNVPLYILGSSLYGAQLAAYMGLPYAFASHFAPAMLEQALEIYRADFRPSAQLQKPHAMIAVGVCAADTDAEATYLRSSQKLAFARLRTGNPGKLPRPTHDIEAEVPAAVLRQVDHALSCSATGSRETVHRQMSMILENFQPDEVIMAGMIHDHGARVRSLEIAAEVFADLQS